MKEGALTDFGVEGGWWWSVKRHPGRWVLASRNPGARFRARPQPPSNNATEIGRRAHAGNVCRVVDL